jgi:PAS domain S-box-containing protein
VLEKMVDQKTSELKLSEEKFRVLVEQNLVAVFIIQDGRFKYSNPGFEDAFGYTKNELLNIVKVEDVMYPDDLEKVQTFYAQRISGKNPPSQYTIRVIRKDGLMLHAEVIASPIMYENKPAVIGTAIDITGRIEEEKRIGKAVTEAQERERMQIGMELHDNVKQIMAATLLNLEYLQQHLDDKQMAAERIGQLMVYMREAIYDLRRLSHQLAPSLDSSASLYDKVDNLVTAMLSSSKMKVAIEVDERSNKLSSEVQLVVFRILQEQIANALKHADATLLNISISRKDKLVEIVVTDNGKGIDPDLKKEGIGLENIRRRAQALDGIVKINSSPGSGFELIVEIPVA